MTEAKNTYVLNTHLYPGKPEPLDRLDNRDLTAIRSALHLYYGEVMEHGASLRDLEHLAALSRRLADVSKTWVAEAQS